MKEQIKEETASKVVWAVGTALIGAWSVGAGLNAKEFGVKGHVVWPFVALFVIRKSVKGWRNQKKAVAARNKAKEA